MLSLLTQLQTASKSITKAVDQYNTAGARKLVSVNAVKKLKTAENFSIILF